jgi:hypothetical protein
VCTAAFVLVSAGWPQAEGQLRGPQGGPAAHSEAARRLLLDGGAAAPGADDVHWGSLPKKVQTHMLVQRRCATLKVLLFGCSSAATSSCTGNGDFIPEEAAKATSTCVRSCAVHACRLQHWQKQSAGMLSKN